MPTYTQTVGGKTYTFDSETPLTPDEQMHEARIFYMEDTLPERHNLEINSANPTGEEERLAAHPLSRRGSEHDDPNASIFKGIEEGAKDTVYGLANAIGHPLETAKGMWDAQVHQGELATQERKKGNYAASLGRDALAAIPVLGPFAANIGEDLTNGVLDNDPTALGRGGFNSVLFGGAPAFKAVKSFGPGVSEAGIKLATSHPGVVPGLMMAAEEFARTGKAGQSMLKGVATGAGVSSLKTLAKDISKSVAEGKAEAAKSAEGAAAAETPKPVAPKPVKAASKTKATPKSAKGTMTSEQEAAMARDEAALNERLGGEDVPTPGNGTFKEAPKPEAPAPPPSAASAPTSAPKKPFSMRNPNFLKEDVAGYKPGSKFNPKDRTLSIPGDVAPQITKLLRGDESVMGLARELGLDIPEGGFDTFPEPKGPALQAQALRQRASVAGQRNRTRPTKTAKKPLKGEK